MSEYLPLSTYRLQVNRQFRFQDVADLADYLEKLGVGAVYLSPYFRARPESTHGYDICDHNELNPALGGWDDFQVMSAELRKRGLGHVCDFVPNHMGIGEPLNKWWMDVLENGPSSAFAGHFDIDWKPVKEELRDKVLLPVLGDQYGAVLENGELKLSYESGAFFLRYYDHLFPLNPRTYRIILQEALKNLAGYHNEELFLELQSIMTALDYLPSRSERDPAKIQERSREKEIIKRRLERLSSECPQVLEAIQQSMHRLEGMPGTPSSFDELHALLDAQAYRLSYWRVAAEEINYRRFFDINDLAAIRMERDEVFEDAHRLLFRLVGEGAVDGLRIDHPDGLWDPKAYFEKLQTRAGEVITGRDGASAGKSIYLVVEKILEGEEELREDWPVHGTTGYEFNRLMTGVLVDGSAEHVITEAYFKFIDDRVRFDDLIYRCKNLVMRLSLANDVNALAHMLNRLSEHQRRRRDFTLNALTAAVREVIATFPVYRTYLVPGEEVHPDDQQAIHRAVAQAKRRNPAIERSIFDFLRELLLFRANDGFDDADRREHERFVMKFQQCTGPVMAKGLEDTAFYIYNRLTALNEVGGAPDVFGVEVETFHEENERRARHWPQAMLNSSSHDTKRSEDVRARIAALSEIPQVWRKSIQKWRMSNWKLKREVEGEVAPDANEEYLFYQTILGTWPLGEPKEDEWEAYVVRIQDYMTKAVKEAKVNSSWIQPNEEWDEAVREFVRGALTPGGRKRFLKLLEPVVREVARLGAYNSLTQVLCKLVVPGVPDLYQGNELWDFSLVDPDNRRPVDFQLRRDLLDGLENADPRQLLAGWSDGRIKMWFTSKLLKLRRAQPELFLHGDYQGLGIAGEFSECGLAFIRRYKESSLIAFAPRLVSRLEEFPNPTCWGDATLKLPGLEGAGWTEVLTGREVAWTGERMAVSDFLGDFPYAVLVRSASVT